MEVVGQCAHTCNSICSAAGECTHMHLHLHEQQAHVSTVCANGAVLTQNQSLPPPLILKARKVGDYCSKCIGLTMLHFKKQWCSRWLLAWSVLTTLMFVIFKWIFYVVYWLNLFLYVQTFLVPLFLWVTISYSLFTFCITVLPKRK